MNEDFLAGLTGIVVTPDDPQYEQSRQVFNRAVQKYPLVINYCLSPRDVQNAVFWARRRRLDIRIRSGGHNYEGYCVGNGVLVIDLSRMNNIELDEQKDIVRAQGGVTNAQMYSYVGERGYIFSGGTCGTVGVSGLALGGGWGYLCRLVGLACDNLVELQLVDADGCLITANEHRHSDLFWACRGAGGNNFGVVVSLTYRVQKYAEQVTLFELYDPGASLDTQTQFLSIWQSWLRELDNRIGAQGSVYNSAEDGPSVYARGLFLGPPQEALAILSPFFVLPGLTVSLRYLPFAEAMAEIASSYPPYEWFQSAGRFARQNYTDAQFRSIAERIQQDRPAGSILTTVGVYALGGKVSDKGPRDTAFFYRDAPFIFGMQSAWVGNEYEAENVAWVNDLFRFMKTLTTGSYVNFPIDIQTDYETAYFGENVPRLRRVKEQYDPLGLFAFPQGIRPVL